MKVENTQVQMRKGILEFCILEIIARGEVYASDMLEELTAARMIVVEGTLYPLLTRLKNAGLLDYTWKESTSGPPRKYYTLTEVGQEFLHQLRLTWEEVSDSIRIIRQKPHHNGTDTPAPRVTNPTILSPGTGVQQRASFTRMSGAPRTSTPESLVRGA